MCETPITANLCTITLTLCERRELYEMSDLHCVFIDSDDPEQLRSFLCDERALEYTLLDCDVAALAGALADLAGRQSDRLSFTSLELKLAVFAYEHTCT